MVKRSASGESVGLPVLWQRRLTEPPQRDEDPRWRLGCYRGPQDRRRWLQLHHDCFGPSGSGRAWDAARFDQEFLSRRWWTAERLWLACPAEDPSHDGPLAGAVAICGPAGPRMSINWLAVAPAWRRAGLAARLLRQAEAVIWRLGGRVVRAETRGDWLPAMALYRARGYRRPTDATELPPSRGGP